MNKPRINRHDCINKYLPNLPINEVIILGVRGYYFDSMGEKGKNDRGIYDDAIFVISPENFFSFNANTDPSRFGQNKNVGKGFAVLQEGIYTYQIGRHGINRERATNGRTKAYTALVQKSPVKVKRDGKNDIDVGMFGINIHMGGMNTTSSEGCQTIYRPQWNEFIDTIQSEMKKYKQREVKYYLVEEKE